MRASCTRPLLLWAGRACQGAAAAAASLQRLRTQRAPPTRKCPVTQHCPQANIRQYLCFTLQCTSGLWHTPKFLFLLLDRLSNLTWYESAVCRCSKKSKLNPGLHLQGWYWQRQKRCENPILHSACWATPGVQCPVLVSTLQETHGQAGAGSREGHKGDQRAGETDL